MDQFAQATKRMKRRAEDAALERPAQVNSCNNLQTSP